jgi:hypothetical protein
MAALKDNGKFLNKRTLGYKLFLALPIFPNPGISKVALAEKLKISGHVCNNRINRLPCNIPVYESKNEIGRLK